MKFIVNYRAFIQTKLNRTEFGPPNEQQLKPNIYPLSFKFTFTTQINN